MRVGGVNLTLPSNISHNAAAANTALSINNNHLSTDTSGVSQASSSQSVQQDDRPVIGELGGKISLCLFALLMIMTMLLCEHFFALSALIRTVNEGAKKHFNCESPSI